MDDDIGSDNAALKGPDDWRAGSEDGRRAGKEAQQLAQASKEQGSAPQSTRFDIPGPRIAARSGGLFEPQSPQPQSELLEAWESWLRTIRWDFFATGTWEEPVHTTTALHTVQTWLGKYRGAYAAVGIQRGPVAQTIHIHALLGGANLSATLLRGSWVRSGHVLVARYRHSLGGVEYLVGQAAEIEILGSPIPYRPRVRGRRAGEH